MIARLNLKEVLLKAIQRKIELRLLYLDLSHRVADQAIEKACQELARQEHDHQKRLESYLCGEVEEKAIDITDYCIAEYLGQGEISPGMKVDEVFALIMDREGKSHEFYTGLAEKYPAGEIKKLFEEIASQELEHRQNVEHLYGEVTSDKTGGR